jgi:hypothetical protein
MCLPSSAGHTPPGVIEVKVVGCCDNDGIQKKQTSASTKVLEGKPLIDLISFLIVRQEGRPGVFSSAVGML